MKVLYFAWLRERLNRAEDNVTPPDSVRTIGELIDWLGSNDEAAGLAFADKRLIRAARDEELVDHDTLLGDAKTIALFPPMTGG